MRQYAKVKVPLKQGKQDHRTLVSIVLKDWTIPYDSRPGLPRKSRSHIYIKESETGLKIE